MHLLPADELSSRDKRLLRLYAYKTRAKLTREAFEMLPFACADGEGKPLPEFDVSLDEVDS